MYVSLKTASPSTRTERKQVPSRQYAHFFFPFDFFQGNVKPQKRRGKLERNWISTILFSNSPKYSNHCKKKKRKKKRKKERTKLYKRHVINNLMRLYH